jgi:hypothetical protein
MEILISHWHCIVPAVIIAIVVLVQNRRPHEKLGKKKGEHDE